MVFRDITLEDKDEVTKVILYVCDRRVMISFANILAWSEYVQSQICKENGFTIMRLIYTSDKNTYFYFFPFGQGDTSILLRRLAQDAEESGKNISFAFCSLRFTTDAINFVLKV